MELAQSGNISEHSDSASPTQNLVDRSRHLIYLIKEQEHALRKIGITRLSLYQLTTCSANYH